MMSSNGSSFSFFNNPFPQPSFFSLQDLRDDEVVQNSPLLKFEDKLLDKIIEYVPLKDRLKKVLPVCHRLSESVKRSIKSVEFLRDELDYCEDNKIAFFLSIYGKNVEHMNYDLFRSCSLVEYTQWSWRQSVISSVTKCANLKQLDILVCCRHRLRDGDLAVIFRYCQQLETIRMDASFINGHCFTKAPVSIRKLELECCKSLTKTGFIGMCNRIYKLSTLHVSLLQCLDEHTIKRISDMKYLRNLSIIADPEQPMNQFRLAEVRRMKLTTLCLDGVNNVTDKFLGDITDPSGSTLFRTLEHFSIAWCKNFGPSGLAKLKNLPKLKSLNLDGVSKRDISIGLEAIGNSGRLERLLISEDAFISPKTLVEFVNKCESLRMMDISNNHRLKDKTFAEEVYSARALSFGKPLVLLTDSKSLWRRLPSYSYQNRVEIVNINDRFPEEVVDAISPNTAQQIPRGYLIPTLRRGNRHKMFDFSPNTTVELAEAVASHQADENNEENRPPSGPLDALTPKEQEEFARLLLDMQQPFQNMDWLDNNNLQSSIMEQSTSASFQDSLTSGSAGAPGPPRERHAEKVLKHTRLSKPKRQAQKEKAEQRRSGVTACSTAVKPASPARPSFTDDDFPPLG